MRSICLLLCIQFLFSCASSTVIKPKDPEVKVYVDGDYIGMGSVVYTDRSLALTTRHVRFEKEGCQTQKETFKRNGLFDAVAITLGILTLVPLLWIKEYSPTQEFEFICSKN